MQPVVRYAGRFGVLHATIDTGAAAIDLAGAQVHEMENFGRHAGLEDGGHEGLNTLRRARQSGCGILAARLHEGLRHIG